MLIFLDSPGDKAMKTLWWKIRYTIHAVLVIHCSPFFGWCMADAADDFLLENYSPKEALLEELSRWGD